jgi:hypothetical protein
MRQTARARFARRPLVVLTASAMLAAAVSCGLTGLPVQSARAALAVVGVNDNFSGRHDRVLTVEAPGVLGNDLDLLGSTTVELVNDVSNGTLDLDPDGGFTYVPRAAFIGTDSFKYVPSGLLSTPAQVTITVTDARPVANPDSYTWTGGSLVVPAPGVLANDSDDDGDALTVELDGGGLSGSFDLDEDGGFRYTPGGGFDGNGSIRYRAWDGVKWSATTTISLAIQAATPSPTPTPTPTARPTPTPLLPLPSLPLPSLPLPSLPLPDVPVPSLPLPNASPSQRPAPADDPEPPASERPRPTASPQGASGDVEDPLLPGVDGFAGMPGSPGTGSGTGPGAPIGGEDPGGEGRGGTDSTLGYDGDRLKLQPGSLGILGGFGVWAVPAATIGMPGLLVLLWIALQAGGSLSWFPAVRRLRGDGRANR